MPWTARDATRHNSKANTPTRRKVWAEVANKILASTGDEGRAIREANAAVSRIHRKESKK